MPLLPQFLFDFETEMQVITEAEYLRTMLAENLWWKDITKISTSKNRREILTWLLNTAAIRNAGLGGNMHFEDLAALYTTYVIGVANAGLRLSKDTLSDSESGGFAFAAEWSAQMGAQMVYWPQRSISKLLLAGEGTSLGVAYDGLSFFNVAHPTNPYDPSKGVYANLLTGSPSGALYPGALPIDATVSVSEAIDNVSRALAYLASLKMPDGVTPRRIKGLKMLVPPSLEARARQMAHATLITGLVSGSGGGSTDVRAVVESWGLADPVVVPELSTGSASDATSWYLATSTGVDSQLGALVYIDRESFAITYYTGSGGGDGVDAYLDRARELEWHVQGRNIVGYGHPYGLLKVKAA